MAMWGWVGSAFCLGWPRASCPLCQRPGEWVGWQHLARGEIKMERRGRQLWRLLQFCNEHKKWEHIRYYPALVNLSPTSYNLRILKLLWMVNVPRRVYVGRIVINFLKVLLMGRLRSNLIILSLSPLHRLYGLLLAGICNPLPDWLVLALCSSLNHFNHHMKTPYFEHMKYESTLYWQFCFYNLYRFTRSHDIASERARS